MLTFSSNSQRIISIQCDEILSQIMDALVKSKPEHISEYLQKAAWLYENVPIDLLKEKKADETKATHAESGNEEEDASHDAGRFPRATEEGD